jgi:hypothetical protein
MRFLPIKLLIITGMICCSSCSVNKALREERKMWDYDQWELAYKNRTLCLCVLEGLNNQAVKDSILKHDKSYYDPLAIAIFDSSIRALLKKEIKQIQEDSANSIGRYPQDIASLVEGKRVMPHCLELYQSKRLAELVKQQKKDWKRIHSIIDKIHDTIPTF